MRTAPFTLVAILSLLLFGACGDESDDRTAPRPVALALDFQPNAAHASIYAAVREDLDARHDVALRVRVPGASTDSLKLLAAGRAQFSIVDIHDLGLARERGADVVGVGALVQRPLAAVIARAGIGRPRELEGSRVGVTGLPSDDAVLRAVVEHDGGRMARVRRHHDRLLGRAEPDRRAGGRGGLVLERRGRGTTGRGACPRTSSASTATAPRATPSWCWPRPRVRCAPSRNSCATWWQRSPTAHAAALADRQATVADVARAAGADEELIRAELTAIAPALSPPLRLDRAALRSWAAFDARFGILRRAPDVERAFPRY